MTNPADILYLPALPKSRGALTTPQQAVGIENALAQIIGDVDDIEQVQEWRLRAEAIAAYLKGKDARAPMLGALRRCEARIGQLIGPARHDHSRKPGARSVTTDIARDDRSDFRLLALAVDAGLIDFADTGDDNAWQASRRALVKGFGPVLRGAVESEFLGDETGNQKKDLAGEGKLEVNSGVEFSVPVANQAEHDELIEKLGYMGTFFGTTTRGATLLCVVRAQYRRVDALPPNSTRTRDEREC